MKSRILRFVTALTLFTSLATPARLAAQDQEDHSVIAGTANPVPLSISPWCLTPSDRVRRDSPLQ